MEENKLLNEKDGGRYSLKGSCLWGILLFFILLLVDQVTKIAADVYFNLDGAPDKIVIVPNMIELCMSYNRGIAFSALADAGTTVKMLVVVGTGVVMLAIGALYFKLDKRRTLLRLAIVFIVAGGVGNLIDRIYYRVWDPTTAALIRDGVRDMVRVKIVFDFGVCNFADFFITGGAVMLVLALLFFDKEAVFPLGKKYKALAKEAEEEEEKKRAAKENVAKKDTEEKNG